VVRETIHLSRVQTLRLLLQTVAVVAVVLLVAATVGQVVGRIKMWELV
jgi:hypothetical protein